MNTQEIPCTRRQATLKDYARFIVLVIGLPTLLPIVLVMGWVLFRPALDEGPDIAPPLPVVQEGQHQVDAHRLEDAVRGLIQKGVIRRLAHYQNSAGARLYVGPAFLAMTREEQQALADLVAAFNAHKFHRQERGNIAIYVGKEMIGFSDPKRGLMLKKDLE